MEQQMNKSQLLSEMNSKYTELEQMLTPLSNTQLTTAGVNGEWSIKDILAHLAAWQHVLLDRLQAAIQHTRPRLSFQGLSDEDIDRLNTQFYEENKSRSLSEVQVDFQNTYRQIADAVQAMNEEDLFDAQRFAWLGGTALWRFVAGDTYEHYIEHMEPISEWLANNNI